MKDVDGNPLQIGAMYCCATLELNGYPEQFNELVRYVGGDQFVDADSLEDCSPDFDRLYPQSCSPLSRSVLIDLGVPAEAIDAQDDAEVERRAAIEARRAGD